MSDNQSTRLHDGEGLEIADPADFEVRRDEDGELIPVKQRIPGTDKAVLVRPLTPGEAEQYHGVLEGQSEDSERQADLLSEHIVKGPGADADADYVEQTLRGYVLGGLLQAIQNSSGYDVHQGNLEQQMQEMELMGQMDADALENLTEIGASLNDER